MKEKFLFINDIPLLYPKGNVNRQVRIYLWLYSDEVVKQFKLSKVKEVKSEFSRRLIEDLRYII